MALKRSPDTWSGQQTVTDKVVVRFDNLACIARGSYYGPFGKRTPMVGLRAFSSCFAKQVWPPTRFLRVTRYKTPYLLALTKLGDPKASAHWDY